MGDQPWNRNEGKYDRPSSSAPARFVGKGASRRFEPSSEALREFGADVASGRRIGLVILDDLDEPPSPRPKHYDARPGRRIRKDKPA